MKPEAQRIAIAEACGGVWILIGGFPRIYRMLTMVFNPEYNDRAVGDEPTCNPVYMWAEGRVPDYLNDLNAMHEAEKVLNDADGKWQCRQYASALESKLTRDNFHHQGPSRFGFAHATAAQRAEAFLRTIGKWVEL